MAIQQSLFFICLLLFQFDLKSLNLALLTHRLHTSRMSITTTTTKHLKSKSYYQWKSWMSNPTTPSIASILSNSQPDRNCSIRIQRDYSTLLHPYSANQSNLHSYYWQSIEAPTATAIGKTFWPSSHLRCNSEYQNSITRSLKYISKLIYKPLH